MITREKIQAQNDFLKLETLQMTLSTRCEPSRIGEKFNYFSETIGSKLASSIHPAQHVYEIDELQKSMVLNYTNELEKSKRVASLKNKKRSGGHDGI